MPISAEYREYLRELFACIGPITFKRAFSGEAMMAGGAMVAYFIRDKLHMRTDAQTRPLYEAEGSEPFSFMKGKDLVVTSYMTLPDRLFDDPEELEAWARRAYDAAQQSPTAVARRKKRARAANQGAASKIAARKKAVAPAPKPKKRKR
jgi:DNA transformation protein